MNINIGKADQVLRTLAGVALILWVTIFGGPTWAWIGALPLLTGMLRRCPAYTILGIKTCK